ncbi:HdeD family acid-resistance protein [Enterococcus sp. AZ103]|uniref:HdeD family acid-resistance protein n=1 Tax=Enterococcus sp. AZ103 TaxID=2774628 RepID=UPI003F28C07A
MEKRSGFNWAPFLLGIIFIFVSLVTFRDPESSLLAIVYVFAFSAIFKGVFELFFRRSLNEFAGQHSTLLIVLGIFDIIIGVFLLFNISAGLIALPFVFAIWFIVDSIVALATSGIYKVASTGYYWFNVIVNIIGIILGIMLIFNPISSALTLAFLVGFYFMMMGITLIVYAF